MMIYFAGPDVFRPDYRQWKAYVLALCGNHGWTALIPGDGDLSDPQSIYESNMQDLESADVVLANLTPFRGCEPDSGTVFEAAYALARDKMVIGYIERPELFSKRVERLMGPVTVHEVGWPRRDRDGYGIEETGLKLNLMLSIGIEVIDGGVANAISALAGKVDLDLTKL